MDYDNEPYECPCNTKSGCDNPGCTKGEPVRNTLNERISDYIDAQHGKPVSKMETFSEWMDRVAPPAPELAPVPEKSEDWKEGHRAGYEQRMAEENDDLDLTPDRIHVILHTAPVNEDRDSGSYPRQDPVMQAQFDALVSENLAKERATEADPIIAAGAETWDPNYSPASYRPKVPSLNEIFARVRGQAVAIQALRRDLDQRMEERVQAGRKLEICLDDTDDDIYKLAERLDREIGKIKTGHEGDVRAINERLDTIEQVLEAIPGVARLADGKWIIDNGKRKGIFS
jgi:hypothetical protein